MVYLIKHAANRVNYFLNRKKYSKHSLKTNLSSDDEIHAQILSVCTKENTKMFTMKTNNEKIICKIVHVIDGDTVKAAILVNNIPYIFKVRLSRINAPELHPKNVSNPDEIQEIVKAANGSKERLAQLIENRICYVVIDGEDKYGRLLGEFYLYKHSDESINSLLLKENKAVLYSGCILTN